ncbi:MAG TPA: hypothetical protein DDW65_00030 [Firmicutes bacterium]|jgi:hypothetical protein|nr:hypothetical protein [Bacillota bacterium]
MEPGNKIMNDISSKDYFLQNSLAEYEQPNIYSLEEEFAKAKKNRDIKPYLIFFGFILLLIVATIFTGYYLEEKSRQIKVDISEFEDLRLKETLDLAKAKEAELNRKTTELDSKARELENKKGELRNLHNHFNNEVQRIKQEVQQQADLENTDKKALQRLDKKGQKQLDQVKDNYETQIAKKQAEIIRLQEQLRNDENKLTEAKLYQYALNFFLKDKKAQGCVLDPRQRKNIILFFAGIPKLATETTVDLYRGDDQYIGRIQLIASENGIFGQVDEIAKGQTLKPFDWFTMPK